MRKNTDSDILVTFQQRKLVNNIIKNKTYNFLQLLQAKKTVGESGRWRKRR